MKKVSNWCLTTHATETWNVLIEILEMFQEVKIKIMSGVTDESALHPALPLPISSSLILSPITLPHSF